MDAQQLDVIVRVAGVAGLLFLAVMLIRDGQGRLPARLFAPLAVCISAFLIGDTPDASLRLGGVGGGVAHTLSGYVAVFIWWFCLASFDRNFRL